ncbi:DUF2079 domain-containing protein [Streptomyces sp. NPDC007856]|uniref:DUF2079 domain-containing protein n=1 Tax=Streptomyces sp. NPDC007856 TaxID=3364781 RepID=UPI00369EEF07
MNAAAAEQAKVARIRLASVAGVLRCPHLWLGAALFVIYTVLSVARFERFATSSWDLSIFEQVVSSYAHLRAPIATIKGPGFNILGDHFSPALVVLAPAYRLFPTPVTLLVVQAALFACSAAVVSATAEEVLGRAKGILLGAAYGLSWGVQKAVDFDFHEISLAMPLLALALRSLALGRWRRAAWWSAPLVLVKEDLGLTVAAIGLCLFLAGQRRLGAALGAFGAAATAVVMTVIIPWFNTNGDYDYWGKVSHGSGAGGLTDGIGTKTETLLWVLGVTAFLVLRSRLVLIALPTLGWRFLADDPNYWGRDWHYSAVLMPIVFVALIDGIRRAEASPRDWVRGYARGGVAAATAVAGTLCLQLPVRGLLDSGTFDGGPRAEAGAQAVRLIPSGVSVEANTGLMAHLAGRTQVYWVGNTGRVVPQYIALDLASGWSSPIKDVTGYANGLHPGTRYRLVFNDQQYAVLTRT